MGIGRRIIDLARANLNALMDRASNAELDGLSEKELEAELERRRQERSAQEQERIRRVSEEAAAKSRGSKRAKSEASEPKRTRGTARRASEAEVRAARVRVLYKTLGVSHGAPMDEVKRAYRALMREHHPDRHAGDAAKQKAASSRSATITTAYAELEILIAPKRR